MFHLPDITKLSSLSVAEQTAVLDNLFEPCPTLTSLLVNLLFSRLYTSYKQLIETARSELLNFLQNAEEDSQSSGKPINEDINSIISAHPRLGAPKEVKLSDHSSTEQKSLLGTEEQANRLRDLNQLYEKTFPGLRYVVFVNGRSRDVVMDNMKQRINRNDIKQERVEAFNAMCDIALDRAKKLGAKL